MPLPPRRFIIPGLQAALCLAVFLPAAPQESVPPAADAAVPAPAPDPADERLAEARLAAAHEQVDEAISAYDAAVRIAPGRTDNVLEYAAYLKRWGFWLRGAEQYRKLLAGDPDNLQALLGYGELLNSQYQFRAAMEQFGRILAMEPPPDVHAWERAMLGYGSARFGLEDYAGAAATFEETIARSPGILPAYAFLATTRRHLSDLDGAEAAWNRLLSASPNAPRAAARRREIQDLKSRIQEARAIAEANPGDPQAWVQLGERLSEVPDPTRAAVAYAGAVALRPGDAALRFRLGVSLRDAGNCEEGIRQFQQITEDPAMGATAAYNLAFCGRTTGRLEVEASAWSKAVERSPLDMYAYGRYVEVLLRDRRLSVERARLQEQVRAIVARDAPPRDPMPWIRLSMIHHAEGDSGAARRAALEALAIDMNHIHVRRAIRNLFALENDAVEILLEELSASRAPGEDPGLPARLRGALLFSLGRPTEAEALLRRDLDVAGPSADIRQVALGSCLRELGSHEEAIPLLENMVRTSPEYIWGRLDLALAYLASGRPSDAAAEARRATLLDPVLPTAHALLGAALRRTRDLRGAAAALERALALDPLNVATSSRLLLARVYGALGMPDQGRRSLLSDLPREPREMYRLAWEFVRDTYHDRTFNGQDWKIWEARFDGKLGTTSDALGAVGMMLASLDDRNTRLRTPEKTINLFFTPRSHEAEFLESGAAGRSSRTVEARRLEDNVGYIAITNLDDPQSTRQIEEAVETLSSADGLILDLRGNQGGSDADVAQIAGMFLPSGVETGKIVGPQGTTVQRSEAPPGRVAPIVAQGKPVVVLVDRNTGSSAENLAGSLRESGRAVLVGERTFGKSGVQIPLLLSDGTIVLVVAAEHANLEGDVYTGAGLEPDLPVDASGRGGDGEDRAVGKAKELIRKPGGGNR